MLRLLATQTKASPALAPSLYLTGVALSAVFEGIDTSRRIVELLANFFPPAAVPTVESVQSALQIRGDLVIVALPGLLWIATHALSTFQYALNIVFARNPGLRHIWHSRVKGFAVLISVGLFLAAFIVTNTLRPLFDQFRVILDLPPTPYPLAYIGSAVVSSALTFIIFYLFYRFLLSGRVPRRPAVAGALLATSGWELARQLFSLLLEYSPGFGLVTGTLAAVLTFLFWIYTGVTIVLLGAEFAAVLNGDRPRDAVT